MPSEFPSPETGYHAKLRETRLLYFLSIDGGRILGLVGLLGFMAYQHL